MSRWGGSFQVCLKLGGISGGSHAYTLAHKPQSPLSTTASTVILTAFCLVSFAEKGGRCPSD